MFLIVPGRWFGLFLDPVTRHDMYEVLLIGDGSTTFVTRLRSGLTLLQMGGVGLHWHVEVTILTILGFLMAFELVPFDFS